MYPLRLAVLFLATVVLPCTSSISSTAGIQGLVRRRLPNFVDDFTFAITAKAGNAANLTDSFTVSNGPAASIHIEGNSASALASGLHWYLDSVLHVDIYWFIGSQLYLVPSHLPRLNATYHGLSTVSWRYHFNTVTFSYTSAFWDWEQWESQLDWMALRGINLALAWNGYEYIFAEVLRDAGFTDEDLATFLSGPAFQAWNRFGNIQASWGGDLPMSWIEQQFSLNKQIVSRMVELGITPVLPAFTGFVPYQISQLYPNASFVNGSNWEAFPTKYTNVTFLEPFDPLFASLQKTFISKQNEAYGNVTHFWTLDQYNENNPYSGDMAYLRNVSSNTVKTLKAADPSAIWLLQGWLFYSSQTFWTNDRVEAYLGGVDNTDMLILDLFSESQPQWQRTNSYYGKPWIWCELHDYGGNMGLYGQVENVTINAVKALANTTSTMAGVGLTMEGEAGGEIMYDLLLAQAWSRKSIDTRDYFESWVTTRYHAETDLPRGLYSAWDAMRQTVYNNTNLSLAQATTKSIFELSPNTTGLLNRTGHHPTTITYDTTVLVSAWQNFYGASSDRESPSLWNDVAYRFDLTDITRQVMANAFYPFYTDFINAANRTSNSTYSAQKAMRTGQKMLQLLNDLDTVLAASQEEHFSLPAWIAAARSRASLIAQGPWQSGSRPSHWRSMNASEWNASSNVKEADFYEYNARNQITLWGPTGQISDYASKQWAGLISSYYVPRWKLFIDYTLNSTTSATGANPGLTSSLLAFEEAWQLQHLDEQSWLQYAPPGRAETPDGHELKQTIEDVIARWPDVFGLT